MYSKKFYSITMTSEDVAEMETIVDKQKINDLKEKVMHDIFLSKDVLTTGKEVICINYPDKFKPMHIKGFGEINELKKFALQNNILDYYSYSTMGDVVLFIIKKQVAHYSDSTNLSIDLKYAREDYYKKLLTVEYNKALDLLKTPEIVQTYSDNEIDELNRCSFV